MSTENDHATRCRELAASFLPEADLRVCEFCGCLTNAKMRRCCRRGTAADSRPLFSPPTQVTEGAEAMKTCPFCGSSRGVRPETSSDARVNSWIPVEERLPELGVTVLATGFKYGDPTNVRWYMALRRESERSDIGWWAVGIGEHRPPTHWMPLTEPPAFHRLGVDYFT